VEGRQPEEAAKIRNSTLMREVRTKFIALLSGFSPPLRQYF
jgi:hypothetical protein